MTNVIITTYLCEIAMSFTDTLKESLKTKKKMWIIIASVAALTMGMFTCCVGAVLIIAPWGGPGKKLVGSWENDVNLLGMNSKVTVEFKSNGRFTAVDALGESFTGSWKVRLVEGNVYQINIIYDNEPDRVSGWTVTFKDNDTMTLGGFMGMTPTLKRKK